MQQPLKVAYTGLKAVWAIKVTLEPFAALMVDEFDGLEGWMAIHAEFEAERCQLAVDVA